MSRLFFINAGETPTLPGREKQLPLMRAWKTWGIMVPFVRMAILSTAGRPGMDQLLYASTNKQTPQVKLAEALLQGQAPDRGLYLPVAIPTFVSGELIALRGKSYPEIAVAVLSKFADGVFSAIRWKPCAAALMISKFL